MTASPAINDTANAAVLQLSPVLVGPLSPFQAAYDPSTKLVYVSDTISPYFSSLQGITAVNGTNWASNFPACSGALNSPQYIVFDPANTDLYFSCVYPGNVEVVNPATQTVVATISVGSEPGVVAYDPADEDIYVSNYGSNTVSVISSVTNTVVATVNTGEQPMWITYSAANKDIYVIDTTYPYGIAVINGQTNTLINTIAIEASNAIYDPANQYVYAAVTKFVSGVQEPFLYAISGSNQIVAEILLSGQSFPAAEYGGSLVYDTANDNVFVGTDPGTTGPNVVSEISSSSDTVIGTANIPSDCTSSGCFDLSYLTYNPNNQEIYVSGPGQYVYIISSSDALIQTISLTVIVSSVSSNFPVVSIYDPENNEVFVLCSNYAEIIIPLSG